jgi:hypothetical protein
VWVSSELPGKASLTGGTFGACMSEFFFLYDGDETFFHTVPIGVEQKSRGRTVSTSGWIQCALMVFAHFFNTTDYHCTPQVSPNAFIIYTFSYLVFLISL